MKRAFLGVAASNLIGAGLGFLVNIILARLLDVSMYGRINLLLSIIMIFYTTADFGFGSSLVVYYNRHKAENGNNSIYLINYYYLKLMLLVAIASVIILLTIKKIYLLSVFEVSVIFLSFLLICCYRYFCAIHQAVGDWLKYNSLNILNNLIKLLSMGVVFYFVTINFFDLDYYAAALWGYIIYVFVLFVISVLMTKKYLCCYKSHNVVKKNEIKKIILPIGVAGIFVIITMRIDGLLIGKILGSQSLGIYSAANSLALIFPIITGSLMNVLLRESSNFKEAMLEKILLQQKKFVIPALLILILSMVLSEVMITMLLGSSYRDSVSIFRILLVAYIGGVFFTPLETYFYSNKQKLILQLKFVQMILFVVLAVTLLNVFGLHGVAYAVVVNRICAWSYLYAKACKSRFKVNI